MNTLNDEQKAYQKAYDKVKGDTFSAISGKWSSIKPSASSVNKSNLEKFCVSVKAADGDQAKIDKAGETLWG